MLEMVIAMIIIAILALSLMGGYVNMQRTQRLSNAAEKVLSTLHLARSMAISNNAVYHVRLEDYEVISATSNPITARLLKEPHLSVYCFPSTSDAVSVITEPAPTGKNWWSEHGALDFSDPADPTRVKRLSYLNKYTNQPLNNYRIERVGLEQHAGMGVQDPVRDFSAGNGPLLYFNPDGTASQNMTFFVADDEAKLYDDTGKAYSVIDDKSKALAERQMVAELRKRSYNQEKTTGNRLYGDQNQLRMIRVYRGGMIKLVPASKEKLPPQTP